MAANTPLRLDGVFVCVECHAPVNHTRPDGSRHRPPARCAEHAIARIHTLLPLYGRAHGAVSKAIRLGQLTHPTRLTCTDCGAPAEQYDHRDYSKPLVVEPVCRSCNAKRGPAVWGH